MKYGPFLDRRHQLGHEQYLEHVLERSVRASDERGVIVESAIVVSGHGEIVSEAFGRLDSQHDPSEHAPLEAYRRATQLPDNGEVYDWSLYSSHTPSALSVASTVALGKAGRLVWVQYDPEVTVGDEPLPMNEFLGSLEAHFRHMSWAEVIPVPLSSLPSQT